MAQRSRRQRSELPRDRLILYFNYNLRRRRSPRRQAIKRGNRSKARMVKLRRSQAYLGSVGSLNPQYDGLLFNTPPQCEVSMAGIRRSVVNSTSRSPNDQSGRHMSLYVSVCHYISLYAYLGGVGSLHDMSQDVSLRRFKSLYIVIIRYKALCVVISRYISLYVVICRCKSLYVAGSRYIP